MYNFPEAIWYVWYLERLNADENLTDTKLDTKATVEQCKFAQLFLVWENTVIFHLKILFIPKLLGDP